MPVEFEISRKRLFLIIVIVAILVGAIIALFFLLNRPPAEIELGSWNGEGPEIVTTESFTVNGTGWHIKWEASGYGSSSGCHVSAYSPGVLDPFWESPSEQLSGESPHFTSQGTFYLKIIAEGTLNSWSVWVYQTT